MMYYLLYIYIYTTNKKSLIKLLDLLYCTKDWLK